MRGVPSPHIDVLFAAYGGGHVTMLHPVAKMLAADGISTGFLALTTAQAYLERHGVDYFGFAELEGATDENVLAWGRELAGEEPTNPVVLHKESIAYHGLNFRDLVSLKGESGAREFYKQHGRQGFMPVPTMEALLRRLRPKLVVATNSPRSERALFVAARNLGIPALCLVDLFAIHEAKWISEPRYAARICVLNEHVAQHFIAQGADPGTLAITGNPAFDPLSDPQTREAGKRLRRTRGYADGEKVILWASNVEPERHPFTGAQGDPTLPRRIEAELRRIVASEPHWHLIVRYHPSENVEFQPSPTVSNSPRTEDLHALIHAVDAVVVASSTVGLEAHLAGQPVVSLDMSVFTDDAPYSRMGISRGVTDLTGLRSALRAAMESEGLPADPHRTGTSTAAVCREIKSLLARHRDDGLPLSNTRSI